MTPTSPTTYETFQPAHFNSPQLTSRSQSRTKNADTHLGITIRWASGAGRDAVGLATVFAVGAGVGGC
jgi:hypothetical protein